MPDPRRWQRAVVPCESVAEVRQALPGAARFVRPGDDRKVLAPGGDQVVDQRADRLGAIGQHSWRIDVGRGPIHKNEVVAAGRRLVQQR